jgi:mRNA interferase RelE/StbE
MTYRVFIDTRAARDMADLPTQVRAQMDVRIAALSLSPRPGASEALAGNLVGMRRLRVGDYRIAYVVDDEAAVVRVRAVGHRSRFYQDLGRSGP